MGPQLEKFCILLKLRMIDSRIMDQDQDQETERIVGKGELEL